MSTSSPSIFEKLNSIGPVIAKEQYRFYICHLDMYKGWHCYKTDGPTSKLFEDHPTKLVPILRVLPTVLDKQILKSACAYPLTVHDNSS
jgi:hypothetical protein